MDLGCTIPASAKDRSAELRRMVEKPWDNWIPGVLNKRQMQVLVDEGILWVPNDTIDAASLDLTLTSATFSFWKPSKLMSSKLPNG
jgi:hypothetical protein